MEQNDVKIILDSTGTKTQLSYKYIYIYIYIYIYMNLNSWRRGVLVKGQAFPTSFDLAAVFKGNYFVFRRSTEN